MPLDSPRWLDLEARGLIAIAPNVRSALLRGSPVVALESTIVSHGMPYPQNLDTALAVEAAALEHGATPATIAILDGVIRVGLVREQLRRLALLGRGCRKTSRRDLAYAMANKLNGATTVAATMHCASLVGIQVFVTGGIGGVHRGVERTMDVSADLTELGRTPVAVVCAGVKSILDIKRTLEYLETQGVSVAAYGQDEFPAFFTPDSGCAAPIRVDSATEYAKMILSSEDAGLTSGMVLGVPVPAGKAAELAVVEEATANALKEADAKNISGKDITPFLLQRINELTGGKSLEANIALIKNNCAVGSQIAKELSKLKRLRVVKCAGLLSIGSPVVVGGTNVDLLGKPVPGGQLLTATSNMGSLSRSWGGVGRNIADGLARLAQNPYLVTAVGNDSDGKMFPAHCEDIGIESKHSLISPDHNTSTYLAIFDEHGDLFSTIAAMEATQYLTGKRVTTALINIQNEQLAQGNRCPLVILDGNLEVECLREVFVYCSKQGLPCWFEPTSFAKSTRVFPAYTQGGVQFLSPSEDELVVMHAFLKNPQMDIKTTLSKHGDPSEQQIKIMCKEILTSIEHDSANTQHIIVTRAAKGACVASYSASKRLFEFTCVKAIETTNVVNSSGAGDAFVAGSVYALLRELESKQSLLTATHAAVLAAVNKGGLPAGTLTVESAQSFASLTPAALTACTNRDQMRSKL